MFRWHCIFININNISYGLKGEERYSHGNKVRIPGKLDGDKRFQVAYKEIIIFECQQGK